MIDTNDVNGRFAKLRVCTVCPIEKKNVKIEELFFFFMKTGPQNQSKYMYEQNNNKNFIAEAQSESYFRCKKYPEFTDNTEINLTFSFFAFPKRNTKMILYLKIQKNPLFNVIRTM